MGVNVVFLAVLATLVAAGSVSYGSKSSMEQFLDLVALRCLDKTLSGKVLRENELKKNAETAADEILETLEFLDGSYLYQVAVALGGPGADGVFATRQEFTGKSQPTRDTVLAKYYPMGQFAAYAYIYAAIKVYSFLIESVGMQQTAPATAPSSPGR